MNDIGDRYYVGKFGHLWAVYDLQYVRAHRHSTHPDEFRANVACAVANTNYHQKRGTNR